MFGKVKNWFGIEGIKVEMNIPEEINEKLGVVKGSLLFSTMNQQTISSIKVVMIETYRRGRKEMKRIDDYEIGRIILTEEITISPNEPLNLDFVLPFEMQKSEMDEFASKNFFAKGIVNLAKRTRNVKSTFRVEVEADVKGTGLNPFDKKTVKLK